MNASEIPTAKFYSFDHEPAPDSCWSLSAGPDGRIYAASCCEHVPGGKAYIVRYDEQADALETVVDVPEAVGMPADNGQASQCKIHYSFAASPDGTLYAATHLSAPGIGTPRMAHWGDWRDARYGFPQSMLLAYDTAADRLAWTGPFIPHEGCRCLALAPQRGLLYAVSYPRDHFWVYDLKRRSIRSLGRLGSVNAQTIFTDRLERAYTTNADGQLVRYDPETDTLEELPVFCPHDPQLRGGWHNVLYDVAPSPEGDCVYGVPWNSNPHLFRYWPEDGPDGRMEDLGPVHQDRDRTMTVSYYLDHCGGLVFGCDGRLYMGTSRWEPGLELHTASTREDWKADQVLVALDVRTLQREDIARLEKPGSHGNYVSRGARDRNGDLFFGHVNRPVPVGLSRVVRPAEGEDLHLPLRTWG